MAEAERFIFTEDMAIKALTKVLHEVYSHGPTSIDIRLTGAVDEVPEVKVSYTTRPDICLAWTKGGYENEQR